MKTSAGILPFKRKDGKLYLFLIHMGGPYWKNRDRSWSIVKGEVEEGEDLLQAALREFKEETGLDVEIGHKPLIPLGEVKTSGKKIVAWAVNTDLPTNIHSNTFEIEWPPKSGRIAAFPEADRAEWMSVEEAKRRIVTSQREFIERLLKSLSS
ncbi:NUDIX domain-containing protein [Hydrogenimonas sp.]